MSSLFIFHSFLKAVLLGICTCTYLKMKFPAILEQRTGFRGFFWKAAIIGAKLSTFTLNNNYPSSVWPAILTSSGPPLSITGIELPLKASSFLDVSATWSGHIWARNQCANVNGKFQCQTGDCASSQIPCNDVGGIPPVTLAEFTLAANNVHVLPSTNLSIVAPGLMAYSYAYDDTIALASCTGGANYLITFFP
ncbi:hypothetical protein V6N12_049017 [Hibiscus sabdariffa]|uniref:Thaumatin-like protein n=1 Tax=Hibiscus sabdariffa TaxID=183260 RepID=A0ABR2ELA3_9ROSI